MDNQTGSYELTVDQLHEATLTRGPHIEQLLLEGYEASQQNREDARHWILSHKEISDDRAQQPCTI